MSKKKYEIEDSEYEYDFAMSFADMMTALVGAFLVLLMFFMYQNSIKTESVLRSYEESASDLKTSQNKVQNVLGIRKDIIKEIGVTLLNSNLDISMDVESGAIRCKDNILFAYDSDIITSEGKKYLNSFIPKYMTILLKKDTLKYISEIIIEGHTDNRGEFLYNLDLSQRRALAVSKYILSDEMPYFEGKEVLKDYLTSTGKSYSKLLVNNGKIDYEGSRRVEFKFRLREEETFEEIKKIFEE